jgi:hypothetical protein
VVEVVRFIVLGVEVEVVGDGVDHANVGPGLAPREFDGSDGCIVVATLVLHESNES